MAGNPVVDHGDERCAIAIGALVVDELLQLIGAEAAELFRSSGFKAEKTLRLEAGEEQLMSVTAEEFALLEPFL